MDLCRSFAEPFLDPGASTVIPDFGRPFRRHVPEAGLLLAAYSFTFGLFQVPSGYLVDQYGAKPVLIGGLLLNGIALALYSVHHND
jgi:MFS family permease